MEASETFGAGVESPEDDPFAGSDFGDFGEDESTATGTATAEPEEAPVATEEIPVVNAEGERVPPPIAPTDGGQTAQSAEPVKESAEQAAEREAAEKTARDEEAAVARKKAAEIAEQRKAERQAIPGGVPEPKIDAVAEAKAEVEKDEAALQVQPGAEVPSAEEDAAAEADLTAAREKLIEAEQDAGEVVGAEPPESDLAPEPEEKKDKKNRVTHRRYIILQVISPGTYKQIHWYQDDEGKMVSRGGGARKQKIALARDGEGALAIGYAAIGSPEGGAPLVAVADSLFRVVHVAPDEPEPAKRKLKFS